MKTLRISTKLPLLIVGLALVATVVASTISYIKASGALVHEAENKLTALMESRKQAIGGYLGDIRDDLIVIADHGMTHEALRAFEAAGFEFGTGLKQDLQRLYLNENPNPTGEKHRLDRASDSSQYSEAHGRYHPWFREFLEARGYYDIFLVSAGGEVIYTVYKELDYATNLNTGEWKSTDLAKVYREVRSAATPGSVAFVDFKPYAPSNDAPASFIATPLLDDTGKFEGAFIFQMPFKDFSHSLVGYFRYRTLDEHDSFQFRGGEPPHGLNTPSRDARAPAHHEQNAAGTKVRAEIQFRFSRPRRL